MTGLPAKGREDKNKEIKDIAIRSIEALFLENNMGYGEVILKVKNHKVVSFSTLFTEQIEKTI